LIGRPSASTQYRVPINGTLPSTSPLYKKNTKEHQKIGPENARQVVVIFNNPAEEL